MTLVEHLTEAARHLKEATKLSSDWRVREAAVGAGTAAQCAPHIQKKIASGQAKVETTPSGEQGAGSEHLKKLKAETA